MAAVHGGGFQIVADNSETLHFSADHPPFSFSVFDLNGRIPDLKFDGFYDLEKRSVILSPKSLTGFDVRKSPLLPEGWSVYGRITAAAAPAELPDPAALAALGEAMIEGTGGATLNSNIPAAYTYLGQLVAHDMTKMAIGDLGCDPLNFRSTALDLDGVFGKTDGKLKAAPDTCWSSGLGLGRVSGGEESYNDLPRTESGEPVIPDQRNDHNLAVAQLHVAIAKFHRAVASRFPSKSPKEQRTITLQHFQSVVLFDYLRRIIDPEVYADVLANGRAVVHPEGNFATAPFLVPVEFAAACFRFGHSMVRAAYQPWNEHIGIGTLGQLLGFTYSGGQLDQGRLPADWIADWKILALDGDESDRVKAGPIDTLMSQLLFRLPGWMFPTRPDIGMLPTANLAARTLLRGFLLQIPCAQKVAEHVRSRLGQSRPGLRMLSEWEIADVANERVASCLRAGDAGMPLMRRTPLWFYALRESEHPSLGNGKHLGPLASRIVMESIHAAIEAAPDGIAGRRFAPRTELGGRPGSDFTLQDLLTFVTTA